MSNAQSVITKLKQGNQRFREGLSRQRLRKPLQLIDEQRPHTIVLTCADSRVPPELIFDQDLGDLFVLRVAGNTANDEIIGSIEYAALQLGSQVCIVLGHTNCGAVGACLDSQLKKQKLPTVALEKVVDPIKRVISNITNLNADQQLNKAIELNVELTLDDLKQKSIALNQLHKENKLTFIGAKYHLKDGLVEFI